MTDKQMMVYGYIKQQYNIECVKIMIKGEDAIILSDGSDQLTLTCDNNFNIIDANTGKVIAYSKGSSWYNIPQV